MMATCPHCGYSKTPPGKRSCFNCGRPLDAVAPGPAAAQPVAPAPVAPAPVAALQQTAPGASPGVSAPAPMPAVGACPHCGYSKTPPGKRSCFNCGRPLDAVAPGPAAAQPVAGNAAPSAPHTPQPAPPVGPPVWVPTHRVPPPGIAAWDAPDPSRPPAGQLPGNLELVVEATAGAWVHVRVANGWRGWVDGRLLIPISAG
jgi:ribosomal protein L34E